MELQLVRPDDAGEVEPLLREGFEVEHRSWKGTAGSSVLSDAVMWQFYLRQATETGAVRRVGTSVPAI